jgi:hypothetical protein
MYQLLRHAGRTTKTSSEFAQARAKEFREFFTIRRKNMRTHPSFGEKNFQYYFTTDGHAVSIHYFKWVQRNNLPEDAEDLIIERERRVNEGRIRSARQIIAIHQQYQQNNLVLAGLDPGVRSLATVVGEPSEPLGIGPFLGSMENRQYYHEAHFLSNSKQRRLMETKAGIRTWSLNTPSHHSYSVAEFEVYLRYTTIFATPN